MIALSGVPSGVLVRGNLLLVIIELWHSSFLVLTWKQGRSSRRFDSARSWKAVGRQWRLQCKAENQQSELTVPWNSQESTIISHSGTCMPRHTQKMHSHTLASDNRHKQVLTQRSTHTHTHTHTHTQTKTHTHTHTHTHARTHTCTHAHPPEHTRTHTYIHTYTHTHKCTHVHSHSHIHTKIEYSHPTRRSRHTRTHKCMHIWTLASKHTWCACTHIRKVHTHRHRYTHHSRGGNALILCTHIQEYMSTHIYCAKRLVVRCTLQLNSLWVPHPCSFSYWVLYEKVK